MKSLEIPSYRRQPLGLNWTLGPDTQWALRAARSALCTLAMAMMLLMNGPALAQQAVTDVPKAEVEQSPEPEEDEPAAPTPLEQAREVYQQGVQAYEERRYKDAIDLFNQADRLNPNPAFSFNIGIAYEDMGDAARSLSYYRDYVRRAPTSSDRQQVDARIERLEQRLQTKGVQQVTVLSTPPGALLLIDGVSMGATPWTGELPPGYHELTLQLKGYAEEARSFDLPPARAIDVPVTLKESAEPESKPAPAPLAPPPPVAPPVRECEGLGCIKLTTWFVGGAGLASLAGGFLLYQAATRAEDRAAKEPIQVKAEPDALDAVSNERWAVGLTAVGAGLAITGGILAFLDLQPLRGTDPADGQLSASCSPEGCSGLWTGAF